MQKINLKDVWRGLNEHLALPISLGAVLITGLSYCSDQRNAAEERAITQGVVWRSAKSTEVEGMLTLNQPNEVVAIQRVVFTFPRSLRSDPISLPPSEIELRGTWIEYALQERLKACAIEGYTSLMEDQLPLGVTTYYSVAGENRIANDLYTLSYTAQIDAHGYVKVTLQSLAVAGAQLTSSAMTPIVLDWVGTDCRPADQRRAIRRANDAMNDEIQAKR